MEFFIQNKQNQKKIERFVLIFFTFYDINICAGMILRRAQIWIPIVMAAALAASWAAYLRRYRNSKERAIYTTAMIQVVFILYAANVDQITDAIPTFIVMVVLVAFYGIKELMWFTAASMLIIVVHHGFVAETFQLAFNQAGIKVLVQIGNVVCIEYIVATWLIRREENNNQIYNIIEALKEAERSQDDFLANVSHEIRTPVNTICGMSEMALREKDLEKIREEILDIRDAGNNLMSLINDILDFSQLQRGKMDLEEEAYNITSTINDIISMAVSRKGDKNIELIVDCDADIPRELFGDEKKIRRVITNLVDNAIKFTDEGYVSVGVHIRRESYGVNLCITVKDTGIGMREESLEKLFESFSQVDAKRNRQADGIGLGLAISRALVVKMGGTITVRSRLDRGSIVRVVVPQKILDEKPIVAAGNPERLNVATYIDMEQFNMVTIRDEYSMNIFHMAQQLQVKYHVCRNLAELKRRQSHGFFSHIFISLVEYQEDQPYFDELAKHTKVIITIDRSDERHIFNQDLIRLYKPFYILPVVSILNGSEEEGGRRVIRQGKFIAPDVHVLVVDDNRTNIRVIEGLLKEYLIKVSCVTSGQEALDVIENMTYDFVFMDHMMPEMDGIEAMHRIREKNGKYYKRVPIIALTANASPGNREMFLEEGFDDFVSKPVEISVLERVLKRNLPQEKLIYQQEKKEEEPNQEAEIEIGDLDVKQGMLYCGGEKAYLEILAVTCRDGRKQRKLLRELFEKRDWENYTIKVHALKSSMQSIGAVSLFERAKALETAGKKGDIHYIIKHHEDMLKLYRRVIGELSEHPLVRPLLEKELEEERALERQSLAQQEQAQEGEGGYSAMDEDTFDSLLGDLEDAMYSLDGGRMLELVSEMQKYQYHQTALRGELIPVIKKIEMSDYMSAVSAITKIRDSIKNKDQGGEQRD